MSAPYPNMAPSSKLIFEKSSFLHKNSRHRTSIKEHHFNASVSILLPGETIPPDIQRHVILENEESYMVRDLPVLRLIDKEFIEAFVKKGSMYFMSHNTRLDTDDCVALIPPGILVLDLTKDTYEKLGLEGKPSTFTPRHQKPNKFVIHLDMTQACFSPGRRNYNRVWSCLKERLNLTLDFLLCWRPDDDKICPSTMQQYFTNNGYEITPVQVQQETSYLHAQLTPSMTEDSLQTSQDSYKSIYEWLGAVSCGVSLECSSDDYVSTYHAPEPCSEQSIVNHQATGFISPCSIGHLVDKLRSHVKDTGASWVALTVHGFSDSPVSWKKSEHSFYLGGDNLYTYVIFPDQKYWLFSALSTYDVGY